MGVLHPPIPDPPLAAQAGGSRDLRIDFFRGIILLGTAVNHTVPPPALYSKFGHYQFGHLFSFSFADLFVFFSGFVCARAYGKAIDRDGLWGAQKKAFRRCGQIYAVNLVTLACVAGIMCFGQALSSRPVLFLEFDLRKFLQPDNWRRVLLMQSPFNHFNILKFYVVMLLIVPVWLWLYRRHRWAMLSASLAAYLFIQVGHQRGWTICDLTRGPFGNYLAWQFLFFGAASMGIESRGHNRGLSATWVAGLILFLCAADYLRQVKFVQHHLSDKVTLGPLRVAELLAVVALLATWVPRDFAFARTGPGHWLSRLGAHSLEVFAATIVTCYAFTHLAVLLNVGRAGYGLLLAVEVGTVLLAGAWWGGRSDVSVLQIPSESHAQSVPSSPVRKAA